jgi:predicted metal-binding membrane protein
MSDAASLVEILRRDRAIVIAALATLTAIAWPYTILLTRGMDMGGALSMPDMPSMGAMVAPMLKPWSLADFAFIFVMWTVMMVGMMTPWAAPMILIYARVGRQAAEQGRPLASVGWFVVGYLLAWAGFAALATIGQWWLTRAAALINARNLRRGACHRRGLPVDTGKGPFVSGIARRRCCLSSAMVGSAATSQVRSAWAYATGSIASAAAGR